MEKLTKRLREVLPGRAVAMNLLGSAVLAFGLYHVHALSGVTEGGILGLVLLLRHWLGISPAWSGLVLNGICYAMGWKVLGHGFMLRSLVAGGGFSLFYRICEAFPPLWPGLADRPLPAALLGAVFVGVGVGLCVRAGGAPSGDDALAMTVSAAAGWDIRRVYLVSDLTVLALSATYIPLLRLAYSLVTVVLSGQIIGIVEKAGRKKHG